MKTQWIVENFTHESSYTELVKAIKKEGYSLFEIKGDFKNADVTQFNHWDAPVVFLGSIQMTKIIQGLLYQASPVTYCTQENFKCTNYMSHFGKYLFNDKYSIISVSELERQKFHFYATYGKDTMIFVRPDSGEKPFQAGLVDLQDFETFMSYSKDHPHQLVVVSTPKNIRGEWRFVVSSDQDIISCSTYRYQGKITLIPSAPPEATKLVKEMLKVPYYPDRVFVMDVCEDSDGNFWLLELNSFSAAGLYACNKSEIVKKVSAIAEKDWDFGRKTSTHQP